MKRFEKLGKIQRHRKRLVFLILLSLSIFICMALFLLISGMALQYNSEEGQSRMGKGSAVFGKMEGNVFSSHNLPSASKSVEEATIFLSIAAFRDVECVTTVESALTRARFPHRVFIGISEERYENDESCINLTDTLQRMNMTRTRTLRWKDVVPSAFETEKNAESKSKPTPLLHPGRSNDLITCLLSPHAASRTLDSTNTSVLDGCQIITRVGEPDDARGPTYARYITSLFFNNQDYYMVVDSHSRFIPDWDIKMIERARLMPTRGVMSHYPNGYTPENPDKEITKLDVMSMCKGVIMPNNIPKLGARWIPIQSKPVLQGFVAAGYIFGDSQFVRDVPFDPYLPYLFDGEEILYTARLYTSGWDSYCPGSALLYHNYERHKAPRYFAVIVRDEVRAHRLLQQRTAIRRVLYLLRRCQLNTTNRIVTDDEAHVLNPAIGQYEKFFGMGKVRSLHSYWHFTQLSDEFIKSKDNEGRWMGGEGLCEIK
ncbi:UDP-GlcNAc:polypeptide N-acetylglucosaminyltransferase [Trypanosoma theileri]|uniref:UDP-GlcNAc:polypeptide N-acetylglucosaminyltransferase n=1 Tax=Trypanosoma theileri TaxID=67003 RepID=A0A1X0NT28_9TRYP|nr:UDP-GlcNAc:polypeptide N-acetylglucosaminyltransferase [Trypanosoma theileri]ORC87751.1 UDP-GlcNAc:polypeptide N-acetylglucosaminyltransferase [Trypanosoma theileri]